MLFFLVPGTSGRVSTLKELQRCFCPAHSGGDGYRALGGGTGTVTSAQDLREGMQRTRIWGLRHLGMFGEQGVSRRWGEEQVSGVLRARNAGQTWRAKPLSNQGPHLPQRAGQGIHESLKSALWNGRRTLTNVCGWASYLHTLSLMIIRRNNQNKTYCRDVLRIK